VAILAEAGEHRRLVLHIHVHRIDQLDFRLVARIMGAARDDMADQLARGDPQPLADRGGQRFVRMVERQGQFGKAQHDGRCSAWCCGAPI